MRARWATLAAAMAAMVTSCELSPRLYLTVRTEQVAVERVDRAPDRAGTRPTG